MSYTQFQGRRFPVLVETERCTGHCCRRFYLPKSPEDIQRMYDEWKRFGQGTRPRNDIDIIAPMLILLEVQYEENRWGLQQPVGYFYTCKHFDGVGCRIYDNRPSMCSDYPYNGECTFKECTMKLEPLQGCPEPPAIDVWDKLSDHVSPAAEKEEMTL